VSLYNDSLSNAENTAFVALTLNGVGNFILENKAHGFAEIKFSTSSISRACHIAKDLIFNEGGFPGKPGPFKRAAATAILARCVVDMEFLMAEGADPLTDEEKDAWKARIAFLTINAVLGDSVVELTTGSFALGEKEWEPATIHLKLELLALLRWLDGFMIDGDLDQDRLCRAVMALAMIIEQSYYLVDSGCSCPVMGNSHCLPSAEGPEGLDIYFDLEETYEALKNKDPMADWQ
jgi:hypothetical protein